MSEIVHFGDHGHAVENLQRLLQHNRWNHNFLGHHNPDGKFGPLTMTAVREARHFLGYPDGGQGSHIVGEPLRAYLRPLSKGGKRLSKKMAAVRAKRRAAQRLRPRRLKRLAIARRQVGYVESSGNRTKYGSWYGMNGVAWCAIFFSWCDHQAGGGFRYSYTPTITADARAHRNGLASTGGPRPGDGVTFDWSGGHARWSVYDTDHVGHFDHWLDRRAGVFATVEGNTGLISQGNGGMVARKVRTTSLVATFFQAGKL